jgi:hypothetical protein
MEALRGAGRRIGKAGFPPLKIPRNSCAKLVSCPYRGRGRKKRSLWINQTGAVSAAQKISNQPIVRMPDNRLIRFAGCHTAAFFARMK